ncbi:hypothetical protein ACFC1D_21215 [Streptomyces vinaceus]|uniref:GHMP family kinase ATP-binding protein n=1 Tax=Streptomyces vinaceus TaxID=1960 RepID=UPI0035DC64BE
MTILDALPEIDSAEISERSYCGVSHGTLGELYQGPFWQGSEPHISIVSLPVDKFSWCHFTESPDAPPGDPTGLAGRPKSAKAIDLFLEYYGEKPRPGRWEYFSELEVGKGMASSTADIIATIRCLFNLYGITYDQQMVMRILDRIERADSVFLDEFALYLSGRHQVVQNFGRDVGFYACYVVEDGHVDTEAIGAQLIDHYREFETEYAACLEELTHAFTAGDARGVARSSSRSASLSQRIVPKSSHDEMLANQERFAADGIFVAHTGTVIGYLFTERPDRFTMDELSSFFKRLGQQCYFAKGGWGHV